MEAVQTLLGNMATQLRNDIRSIAEGSNKQWTAQEKRTATADFVKKNEEGHNVWPAVLANDTVDIIWEPTPSPGAWIRAADRGWEDQDPE